MAKYKTGGIITKISGSTGGTTFVNSEYGPYLRNRSIPTNTWTPAKEKSKHNHINANRLWEKLSLAQFNKWNELAKSLRKTDSVGNVVIWRACDLFRHVNRNLLEMNQPTILDAPQIIFPQPFNSINVKIYASNKIDDINVFFNPQIPENTKVVIFASRQMKPGWFSTKKHFYKRIAILDNSFISGSSILDNYFSVFIDNSKDTFKIAFRFKIFSTISGFTIPPVEFIQTPD